MPLYRYWSLDAKGKKIEATIDADSFQDAKWKLLQRQIAVTRLAPLSEKQAKNRLKKADILYLTRELSRLLQAGLPLFEALTALEEKYRGQKPHRMLIDLADRVRSGEAFSSALSHHGDCFDILYVSMVSNAEKTGRMALALDELGSLLNRQLQLRKQVISALLYPGLLATFCCVVLSALLFFVVPSLKELFDGRDLHPFTQIVFAVSGFACEYKGYLGLLLVGLATAGVLTYLLPSWHGKIVPLIYRMPVIKHLIAKVAFVRFCRATATLLEGGLTAMTAFPQARVVMRHPVLEAVIAASEAKLLEGEPFYLPLQNHPLIPPLVPRMLAIAAQGGNLPFMMTQIAQIYEEELDTSLAHFTAVAQPLLLLLLGAVVGFVLLSVLLPLTDVSSFASG